MQKVISNFLKYVKIDTQSANGMDCFPSTAKQRTLAAILVEELKEMGAAHVRMDEEHCYVYADIPATSPKKCPVIGFIAHMDTSPAVTGENVRPQIIKNYNGGNIILNQTHNIIMSPSEFPELNNYIGQDLITTDGTTLLGADDKAGIAEIMAMTEYLLQHPTLPHGEIKIAFTPDEEVGFGVDYFDVQGFGADFAYTVDGGPIGELEYENFNAADALLTVHGKSVHPGDAKHKMKNAILLAQEFHSLLPADQSPMYTEGYEGFYHLDRLEGSVEKAVAEYIIRDHDLQKFEAKKIYFKDICAFLNKKYGTDTFCTEINDSYFNMKKKIEPHMFLIDHARQAMEETGIVPHIQPIRGGTDGARLSFMGLPCPNLCTGGHNYHGRFEYCCIQSMEAIVKMLVQLSCSFIND